MANKPTLRFATREDVPIILGLIKELAEYENASDSVEATEASLALTLALAPSHHHNSHHKNDSPPTQSTGYAKTILITAKPEDEVAGMALYFHNYSTWRAKPGIYLEDLFVKPKYRKRGYGTLLLKELAKEVWNEPSLKFYESLGAKQMDGWVGLRVDGEALEKLAKGEVEPAEEPEAEKPEG
ncbi:Peroxygenase 1 [Coniosporium tulheliwenetii]|uniref:Peroxygenase 1 n=1 Tax=Coniosporium tulheliwenetii TaxID=3383036 RepID=A0ACC2YNI3_9PEZI|nr:Peroxygenase 1 [Cladosporium sp. JES 115]